MKTFRKKQYQSSQIKKKKQTRRRRNQFLCSKKWRGGVLWNEKLSPEQQILANRELSGFKLNPNVNDCLKYKNKAVNIKYNLDQIPYDSELSPIKIFKNPANFAELADGVYNFILFWDAVNEEYVLATALFSAYEFASKHYMLSTRLGDRVPPEFILSGELKKNRVGGEEIIEFHDISSLFFNSNPNLKKSFLIFYLKQFSEDNSALLENNFPEFKTKFLLYLTQKEFTFYPTFEKKYNLLRNIQQVYALFKSDIDSYKPMKNGLRDYIVLITDIMNDAINTIFNINMRVVFKSRFTVEDYGEQLNTEFFFKEMCRKSPPYAFDYYNNVDSCLDGTEEGIKGNTCEDL